MQSVSTDSRPDTPAHVPPELVFDFDILTDARFQGDPQAGLKTLQDGPPLFFTPRHGGHWVVVDADMLFDIFQDADRFSAYPHAIPHSNAGPYRVIPIELDPPDHGKYRRLLDLMFAPRVIAGLGDGVRDLANELIEAVHAAGQCEFVSDVAEPLPVYTFLRLMGFPPSEMPSLRARAKVLGHNPDPSVRAEAYAETMVFLGEKIAERRRRPRNDVISRLLEGEIDGRPITDDEALAMTTVILAGGLDTVVGTLTFVIRFLADHPEHRRQLVEDPSLIPDAVEELTRRHCIASVARTSTGDFVFHGVDVRKGDAFWCSTVMLGMDETRAPDALRVDFGRNNQRNPFFGAGVHICPGRHLARLEIRTLLTEWLRRVPDFSVIPGDALEVYTGSSLGLTRLPLFWPSS